MNRNPYMFKAYKNLAIAVNNCQSRCANLES